mgnify:CR=1 FL=1
MVREFRNAQGELAVFDSNWDEMSDKAKLGLGYGPEDTVMINTAKNEVIALEKEWLETKESMEKEIKSDNLNDYYDELDKRIDDSTKKFAEIFGVSEKDVHITITEEKGRGSSFNYGSAAVGAGIGAVVGGPVGAVVGGAIGGFFFDDGGIATGPKSGYMAMLHGTEAVVPLPDGRSIPVKMSGNGGGNTFNITVNAGGITDRTDKRQMAREIGNQIQQEMARSMGVSTTRGAF